MKIIKVAIGTFFIYLAIMSLFSGFFIGFLFFLIIGIYLLTSQSNNYYRSSKSYKNFVSYNFEPNQNYINGVDNLLNNYGNTPWNLMQILISINSYILAKLDGKVSKEEMRSLKESLTEHFGSSVNHYLAKESIDLIKETLNYESNFAMDYGIFNCYLFENYVLADVGFSEKQNYLVAFFLILYEILYKNKLNHHKQSEFLSKIEQYFNLPANVIAYIKNLAYFAAFNKNKQYTNYHENYQNYNKRYTTSYEDDLQRAYKLFNLSPDATESEIKKAFRKLAKDYHPDKYSNMPEELKQQALKKFQEISAAYELLLKHTQNK